MMLDMVDWLLLVSRSAFVSTRRSHSVKRKSEKLGIRCVDVFVGVPYCFCNVARACCDLRDNELSCEKQDHAALATMVRREGREGGTANAEIARMLLQQSSKGSAKPTRSRPELYSLASCIVYA